MERLMNVELSRLQRRDPDHVDITLAKPGDADEPAGPAAPCVASQQWSDGHLIVACSGLESMSMLAIDGCALAPQLWSFDQAKGRLRISAPGYLYDGLSHTITMTGETLGISHRLATMFTSDYRYELKTINSSGIAGWIHDASRPRHRIELLVELNDDRTLAIRAEQWSAVDEGGGHAGFSLAFPDVSGGQRLAEVSIRIRDTGFHPFGRFVADEGDSGEGLRRITGPYWRNQGLPRVLVAVYGGAPDEQAACLASLRASGDHVAHDIVLIVEGDRGIGSIAAALSQWPEHDVVLLNAGTAVPPGWLDRLYRAAAGNPTVATATPLVSSADLLNLDRICQSTNRGLIRDVPLGNHAHGSACLYIRRDALHEATYRPAHAMIRGPAPPESDCDHPGDLATALARLAGQRGWRHIVAGDVMVQPPTATPADGLSPDAVVADDLFTDPALLPGNPLYALRKPLQIAAWRQGGPVVVMVTLGLPGGTARHVGELTTAVGGEGRRVLWLRPRIAPDGAGLISLWEPDTTREICYRADAALHELCADLTRLGPELIHVHHLIDLPDGFDRFILRSGIPYVVTVHDYFFGCPRITLLDDGGNYCGVPPVADCRPCLASAPPHPALHPSLAAQAGDAVAWRAKWAKLLHHAWQVIAPSRSALEHYGRLFPDLEVTYRPHMADGDLDMPISTRPGPGWRIAVIGALGPHKGAAQVHELIRFCSRWERDLRFVLVGFSPSGTSLERYDNVENRGPYAPEDVSEAIAAADCGTALFLSVWPETYCFTLSEALRAGLVPVGYDIGAVGERLRRLGCGVLVPALSGPAAIVAGIRQAMTAYKAPSRRDIDGSYPKLFDHYYLPVPAPDAGQLPLRLADSRGLSPDGWCHKQLSLVFYTTAPLREITLRLWCPPVHLGQPCAMRIDQGPAVRLWLEPGIASAITVPVVDMAAAACTVTCDFGFIMRLDPPDERHASVVLSGVEVVWAGGARGAYRIVMSARELALEPVRGPSA
jgi:glycosyltransferase involved in cell wall biosynthesis